MLKKDSTNNVVLGTVLALNRNCNLKKERAFRPINDQFYLSYRNQWIDLQCKSFD